MKKLLLILLCVSFIFSCGENKEKKKLTKEEKKITEVLTSQRECWNNGDLDGFMKGYWNSEELLFTSTNHKPAYGWNNTLERYKNSYPTKESMGELKFEFLHISVNTDSNSADLKGFWELVRKEDNPKGEFFLELKKFNGDWKITKDSTTSLY